MKYYTGFAIGALFFQTWILSAAAGVPVSEVIRECARLVGAL